MTSMQKLKSTRMIAVDMMLMLIFLGIFADQVSMMMITLPIFRPVVQALDIDQVKSGVMFLICMQLGLLLQPHGLLQMTMRGVAPSAVTMGAYLYRLRALCDDEPIEACLVRGSPSTSSGRTDIDIQTSKVRLNNAQLPSYAWGVAIHTSFQGHPDEQQPESEHIHPLPRP